MNNDTTNIIAEYKTEFSRTTGKLQPTVTYGRGWFTLPNGDKARRGQFESALAQLKTRPTVADRYEMVNGVSTLVKASQHVVTHLLNRNDVIEERDTPNCCSVASETYWTM
jgi:hypothetical protein